MQSNPPPISRFKSGFNFCPLFLPKEDYHYSMARNLSCPVIYKNTHLYDAFHLSLLPFECVEPLDLRILCINRKTTFKTTKKILMWAAQTIGPGVLLEYLLYNLPQGWSIMEFPEDGSKLVIVNTGAPITITAWTTLTSAIYRFEWRTKSVSHSTECTLDKLCRRVHCIICLQ